LIHLSSYCEKETIEDVEILYNCFIIGVDDIYTAEQVLKVSLHFITDELSHKYVFDCR